MVNNSNYELRSAMTYLPENLAIDVACAKIKCSAVASSPLATQCHSICNARRTGRLDLKVVSFFDFFQYPINVDRH